MGLDPIRQANICDSATTSSPQLVSGSQGPGAGAEREENTLEDEYQALYAAMPCEPLLAFPASWNTIHTQPRPAASESKPDEI
ncbi:hypothetical protein CcaCcLH18_14078 [Colletotrichum camelliae]|nr:hypothetical protein CcaCcLH18_14078 [Colletotrichum camelliae]